MAVMSSAGPTPPTYTPSRHRIRLGDAVHDQGSRGQIRHGLPEGREGDVVEMRVDLVDEDQDARVTLQHPRESVQFLGRVDRPRGIGGRVQHDPPCRRRDRRVQPLRRDLESLGHRAGHDDGGPAGQADDVGVAGPVGSRHDHLLPGVERGEHGVRDDLLGAGRHDDLRAGHPAAIGDRVAQGGRAEGRGVAGLPGQRGPMRRLDDVGGRREVRLPGGQGDDIAPLGAQGRGAFAQLDDLRHLEGGDPLRSSKGPLGRHVVSGSPASQDDASAGTPSPTATKGHSTWRKTHVTAPRRLDHDEADIATCVPSRFNDTHRIVSPWVSGRAMPTKSWSSCARWRGCTGRRLPNRQPSAPGATRRVASSIAVPTNDIVTPAPCTAPARAARPTATGAREARGATLATPPTTPSAGRRSG